MKLFSFLKFPIYSNKIVFRIVDEEKIELERIKIVNEGNFSLYSYHEYPEVGLIIIIYKEIHGILGESGVCWSKGGKDQEYY